MDPGALMLQIAACVCFGGATTIFVFFMYRLTQIGKTGTGAYTGTSMRRADQRRKALAASPAYRYMLPWLHAISMLTGSRMLEPLLNYVRGPYAKAGYPGGMEDDEVVSMGFLIGAALTVFLAYSVALLWKPSMMWLALFGVPLGFMVLVMNLKGQARTRELRILQSMPYVLDLLVLILRSGTSLSIALNRVVADYDDHPVGDELGQVLAEIEMGAPRAEAFRRMATRLAISDITSLADAIVQSEELGWPLAETLEGLADRLAAERILRAQATAGAAGVMVMLPSTLVLASAVLLLFAPLIIRYTQNNNTL